MHTYRLYNLQSYKQNNKIINHIIGYNRVKDCELQNRSTEITTLPKFHYYSMFKTKFEIEQYLLLSLPRKIQRELSKFRLSAHNLEIERGRHNNIQKRG